MARYGVLCVPSSGFQDLTRVQLLALDEYRDNKECIWNVCVM